MSEETQQMYQNGRIYKIVDNAYNLCYYGSTVQPLSKRMATHKKSFNQFLDGTRTSFTTVYRIFIEYDFENCKIELVELFPCSIKDELRKREGEYIRNNECVNKCIPGRTSKEYHQDTLEKYAERQRKYRANLTEEKKEAIKEKEKKYREEHKDHIRDRTKQDQEEHKEHLQEVAKKYREEHKDEIKEKSKTYIVQQIQRRLNNLIKRIRKY